MNIEKLQSQDIWGKELRLIYIHKWQTTILVGLISFISRIKVKLFF